MNKKIISFGEIPKELSDTIYEKLNEALYKDTPLNKPMSDLKQFMAWGTKKMLHLSAAFLINRYIVQLFNNAFKSVRVK